MFFNFIIYMVNEGGDFEGQTVRVVVGNGTTKFTYIDRTEKAFEDILNNPEIWSDFFNKLDQNQNSSDLGTDVLGEFNFEITKSSL